MLYLKQFIRSLGHLVLDQSKRLLVSRIYQTELFIIFLSKCFDSIFWSQEYSIKVLFKDHFIENYGPFGKKTYQQNCCRKISFKKPRKGNVKQMYGWKLRRSQEYSVSIGEKQRISFVGEEEYEL